MQYENIALEERTDKDLSYISIVNQDQKKWTLPVHHCKVALEIYQPSGVNGLLLKAVLPFLCKIRFYRWIKCFGFCGIHLSDSLKKLLDSLFNSYDFSVFWGTPSTDQKITIQIFNGKKILGYCKIGDGKRIQSLFQHEQYILNTLNLCGVNHVPQCVGVFSLSESETAFVQTTEKKVGAKVEHSFGKKQRDFITGLWEKTRENIQFEKTDFYKSMLYLRDHVDLLCAKYRQCVTEAIETLLTKYSQNMVFWGVCHRDFTPWNTCVVDGNLFVFDFEYALRYGPKEIDIWHFYIQTAVYERKMSVAEIAKEINQKYKDKKEEISIYLLDNMSMYLRRGNKEDIAVGNWRASLLILIQSPENEKNK